MTVTAIVENYNDTLDIFPTVSDINCNERGITPEFCCKQSQVLTFGPVTLLIKNVGPEKVLFEYSKGTYQLAQNAAVNQRIVIEERLFITVKDIKHKSVSFDVEAPLTWRAHNPIKQQQASK